VPRIEPGLKGVVVTTSEEAHLTSEGWVPDTKLVMPPELFEQYRQGWRCPSCHSPQDEAFPKVCKTVWKDTGEACGYPIKDRINEWLEFNFRGEETLWPDRSDEDAAEDEQADFQKRTGIWLPGKE